MDDKYYIDMIINYLRQWDKGRKSDFMKLLCDKLPDVLDDKQKMSKVRNYLSKMRQNGIIKRVDGNQRTGSWALTKKENNKTKSQY